MYQVEFNVRVRVTGKYLLEVPDEIEFGSDEYEVFVTNHTDHLDIDDLILDPWGEDWDFDGERVIE